MIWAWGLRDSFLNKIHKPPMYIQGNETKLIFLVRKNVRVQWEQQGLVAQWGVTTAEGPIQL